MVLSNLVKSIVVKRGPISIAFVKNIHYKPFNECLNMPVERAIEEFEIVPDVIKTIPRDVIEVSYGDKEVKLGNELKPFDVRNLPTKINYPFEKGSLYTVCMTDPDAPSRKSPTFREWHHYLVVNVPENRVNDGEVLSEYVGSGPPPGTGLHRYVWLVFEQPKGKINPDEKRLTNTSGDNRANFSIDKFAKKYHLGAPIAVNFYQAEYDDYVPLLYKQLGAN